jgi:predicted RNA-binding Zn-ribbon protein involved in translation (DUF1610 family)
MKKPIDRRFYKYKNAQVSFFCPLCSSSRSIAQDHKTSRAHHLQIFILTLFSVMLLYPWWELKTVFSYFFYWAAFEFFRRALFKKNIPCPHCGFDASWYKRDVKVARAKVKEFWSLQGVENTSKTQSVDSATQ